MHISEGILPVDWAGLWFLVAAPFVYWGLRTIIGAAAEDPRDRDPGGDGGSGDLRHLLHAHARSLDRHLLASLRHGPGGLVDRPRADGRRGQHRPVFQALFLAHGGLTTLGANIVSMGVVGAFAA